MSAACTLSETDPPVAGGAVPGGRLLGLVQRMMQTGMAMARCVTRIAQQRLLGEDVGRLAPAGFNATATHNLVVQAVAWTAALRERLRALAGPSRLAPGLPKTDRVPQGRRAAPHRTEITYEATEEDYHDWPALAKPLRMGPTGVAEALREIAAMPNRAVVTQICDNLQRAGAQLGADADRPRIAALEAAARALCPEVDAAADAAKDEVAVPGAKPEDAPASRAAGPPSDEPDVPESEAEHDPPTRPPPD